MLVTFKYRIKDSRAAKHLAAHARAVNFVWNYCCQVQREAEARWKAGRKSRWPSAFDLINLTSGTSRDLGIHANTINEVCRTFARARDAVKGCPKFRSSYGSRRALGWLPHRGPLTVQAAGDNVTYLKRRYRMWMSRPMEGTLKTGAFVEDARGRWYATFVCEVPDAKPAGAGQIGIDLGLKTLATCSDGTSIPSLQHYRQYEAALATASRAGNKRRLRAIHAKIANARRDHIHKATTKLAAANKLIVVGDVSASALARTKMAKSIHDASWAMFKTFLRYKASRRQGQLVIVDERFTSQACSSCGVIPDSSPKGIGALGVRAWVCSDCGASHNRDVNAARNILRLGLECQPPAVEIAP